jgi:hypothetical protein
MTVQGRVLPIAILRSLGCVCNLHGALTGQERIVSSSRESSTTLTFLDTFGLSLRNKPGVWMDLSPRYGRRVGAVSLGPDRLPATAC